MKCIFLLTLITLMMLYCDQNTTTKLPDNADITYLSFEDVPCYEGAPYRILSHVIASVAKQSNKLYNYELLVSKSCRLVPVY
jgi:hypothetical protein